MNTTTRNQRSKLSWTRFVGVPASLCVFLGLASFAQAQPNLVERVFRSELVKIDPIYAPGKAGDKTAIIGFKTKSNLRDVVTPIRHGVLPPQASNPGEIIGHTSAEIRLPDGAVIDHSKPMQIAQGTGVFVAESENVRFTFKGTVIVRWGHDAQGQFNGRRWTDFSAPVVQFEGRNAGARGHFVGTRLLIGTEGNPMEFQSGIVIFRVLRP